MILNWELVCVVWHRKHNNSVVVDRYKFQPQEGATGQMDESHFTSPESQFTVWSGFEDIDI